MGLNERCRAPKLAVLLLAFCYLALLPTPAGLATAWSNGGYSSDFDNPDYGTHDWIADCALALQTRDTGFLSSTYHSRFLLGTEAPDNPDLIGDSLKHHVYYFATGIVQEDDGAIRAKDMYDAAMLDLRASDYSAAAYHIGAMTHYISDSGAFGHTMGDGTDWGGETHHSDYEDRVNALVGSYMPAVSGILQGIDAYHASIALADDVTFGSGSIKPNVWMDGNYDWGNSTFAASAEASLDASIMYSASAIDFLLEQAEYVPPQEHHDPLSLYVTGALAAAVVSALLVLARRMRRR